MSCAHSCGSKTGVVGVVCCGTGSSSRVYAHALLFNIFFAVVIHVTYTRFKADKDTTDTLVHLKDKVGGGRGEATTGEPDLVTSVWGMFYPDYAEVVLQSPAQLRILMGVIVVVCAAFDLTVSEANTEMCLRTKGMSESTAVYSVEAAGRVDNMRRKAESKGTLGYNGKTDTLCVGRDAVDWNRIAGRLIKRPLVFRFVLPYHYLEYFLAQSPKFEF